MRSRLVLTLLATLLLGFIAPSTAEAAPQLLNPRVEYTFGGQITFRVDLQSEVPPREVRLFYRNLVETQPVSVAVPVNEQGEVAYAYDLMHSPLRAFSKLEYWFEVTTEAGEVTKSAPLIFYYEDNRYTWKRLQEGSFRVNWYEGDDAFGQSLMDVARKGLEQTRKWLPFAEPEGIDIYAYASVLEMQSTLRLAGANWVAGHADPDLGVMVVSIPDGPTQRVEMERQIPHELLHILLYQLIGDQYRLLPAWLNEGLATVSELFPDPDYYTYLMQAEAKGSLIPLAALCKSFPLDASGAYLAYAEAGSFVRFLYDRVGSEGLRALVQVYVDGSSCESGPEVALGEKLEQLEGNWQMTTFRPGEALKPEGSLMPWIVVLVVVLGIPLGTVFVVRNKVGRKK
jgi:hypothetical protein